MNISLLQDICKMQSRRIFKDAKDSLINHPFLKNVNQGIVEGCVEFQINQKLGTSILKEFSKTNAIDNELHIRYVTKEIEAYKKIVVCAFLRFAKNEFDNVGG